MRQTEANKKQTQDRKCCRWWGWHRWVEKKIRRFFSALLYTP